MVILWGISHLIPHNHKDEEMQGIMFAEEVKNC